MAGLFSPSYDLMSIIDNIGSTITDAGFGTSITSGAGANQKGTPVSLIASNLVTENVYGISITFCGGNASNSIRRYLADLLIDPNGGTNWSVAISDLFVNNPSLIQGGYRYYFPLFLRARTSVGMQVQCNLAATAIRCGVELYGKPSRPELFRFGNKVQTLGVAISTTSGTSYTPGTSAVGLYTEIGTLQHDAWWWQWGGTGYAESAFVVNSILGDVAVGDVNNKRICMNNVIQSYTAAEQGGKDAFGLKVPTRNARAGELVYVRGACTGTPETTPTTTVYALF